MNRIMDKICDMCGEKLGEGKLTQHWRLKHRDYYRLHERVWLLYGVGIVSSTLLIAYLIKATNLSSSPIIGQLVFPIEAFAAIVSGLSARLYLLSKRESLNA